MTDGSSRQAWIGFSGLVVLSLASGFNQFKVPPVLPVVIQTFGLDYSTAGLLMGVFTIAGIVLSIPAGLVLQRYGIAFDCFEQSDRVGGHWHTDY